MDRIRRFFAEPAAYEPLDDTAEDDAGDLGHEEQRSRAPFSRLEYAVFMLLGIAMLWAW